MAVDSEIALYVGLLALCIVAAISLSPKSKSTRPVGKEQSTPEVPPREKQQSEPQPRHGRARHDVIRDVASVTRRTQTPKEDKTFMGALQRLAGKSEFGYIDSDEAREVFGVAVRVSREDLDRVGLGVGDRIIFQATLHRGHPWATHVRKE